VPTITGSDQTRKQDTYQVTLFFDDLLGYNNEGDADLTLQLDKWAALQEYANYFVQRLNKVKQSILPNYLFIPEAPSITFDSFTGLQRMITVQLSFTLVVPTNCEPIVSKLVECIANIVTSSNLTAALKNLIDLTSTLQASSSLSANLQLTKFAASSLNANASLNASALVSKLAASSLTGAGTLAAELTVGSAFDADAQAFFNRVTTAGGTLTDTEKTAVNTLVIALKADGIWDKMKAIYPMVGASAAACSRNLKSDNFNGTFGGAITYSANGITSNGTTGYLDTGFNPSLHNSAGSSHLSYYSRTSVTEAKVDIGCYGAGFANPNQIAIHYAGGITYYNPNNTSDLQVRINEGSSQGFFIASRTSSTSIFGKRNNNTATTNTIAEARNNVKIFILAASINNNPQFFNTKQCAFASIGDGLTTTDATNFYTRVQAFQTTLNRQINP
jgi:hypothetical protein